MVPTMQELGVDQLSTEVRLALAEQLWDSVMNDLNQESLIPEQRQELEHRIQLADASPNRGISWETIRKEARERWQR